MSDVFDGGFVEVVSKSTGEKQTVPADWLGHPVLGSDFELPPEADQEPLPGGPPTEEWTVPQLKQYAARQGVDLDGATRKDDVLAAITHHEEQS